jgi:hypothetical protein
MAKKRKKWTPEERAAWEERYQQTMAMLQERIDHWTARVKAKEEQAK